MTQKILSMISEELAEVGRTFIFMGMQIECTDCQRKNICLNLEKGCRYRVVSVRAPVHDCFVTESKYKVVEVEKMERTVCVDKKYAFDGSMITFFPSECGQVGCSHYHQCNPDGIDREDKVKIASVGKKAECLIGQNRMVIELQ
ncbi:MAG: UPF0179 family protein [archaeon]|nr:UPF0179 family protein [archaeon]